MTRSAINADHRAHEHTGARDCDGVIPHTVSPTVIGLPDRPQWTTPALHTHTRRMTEPRKTVEIDPTHETPVREPLFRRYQIKIKAGLRAGAFPTGHPPTGF
jgi:hypothetical protein